MSDVELTALVQKAVDDAGVGGRVKVEPTSVPGMVKLIGEVVSEDDRLKADQAARSVEGVVEVMDEIGIGRAGIGRA